MKVLTFILTLEEPFLATQVNNGEPNSAVSYPFVPGSMIRGALVSKYLRGKKDGYDLADDDDGRALFLDGTVRYLNAYLYDAGLKRRLLPKPKSWFAEKDADKNDPIADFAVQPNQERGNRALGNPKAPAGGTFVTVVNGQSLLAEPNYHVTVHNTTDEPGKKKEGVSQMYRYEALAAGQQFQGVIIVEDSTHLADLKALLQGAALTLGGSSTGGYGLVTVSQIEENDKWAEYEAETPSDAHILTCLSDVIVRNDAGQTAALMAEAMGVDSEDITAFQDIRVVGGFNQKWGLPLTQAWAIAAGSVFRIKKDAISESDLMKFVKDGVGERTIEGFGRVALNWHTRPIRKRYSEEPQNEKEKPGQKDKTEQTSEANGVKGYGHTLVRQMANRHLRQQLETKLAALIKEHASFRGLPSATQLSRVRLAARHALAQNDLQVIAHHLDSLKGSRSQWQRARVNNEDLFAWMRANSKQDLEKPEGQAAFQKLFGIQNLPSIAGVSAELTVEIMVEFTARLIDGVMKLAVEKAKKDREMPQREGMR